MNVKLVCLALAAAFGASMSASAGPVNGVFNNIVKVDAKKADQEAGEFTKDIECRGNRRTSILVKGDHKPVTDLEVIVYEVTAGDSAGKIVARDRGTRDLIGVVFTPPRTGWYRIVIRNPSEYETKKNPFNECYLTIK